jgi:aminopeptidase
MTGSSSNANGAGMDEATLERFADLVIGFAANVQPEQIVAIGAEPGKEAFARALAASAYRAGAKFVDVSYFDLQVKRARLMHAPEDSLDFVPSWYGDRVLELGRQRCSRIGLTGPAMPGVLDDLDPARTGRDQLPSLKEGAKVVNDRTTNWTAVPCPTPAWAKLVHPDLPEDEAYAKLVEQILHVCRLDEDDPVAVWKERLDTLTEVREKLNARHLDAVRFEGPGTDLTVGLLPSSKWLSAGDFTTIDGIVHMPNLPSEEVFSCPDPQRTEGVVRSTKPLVVSGSIIRGLEVEFREGRVTRIDAEEGADVLRGYAGRDEGASRLGEVALVDRDGRIGPLDTVFFDTLLDENAASHIAIGQAYAFTAGDEDRERINNSAIHIDFMIGGPGVNTFGIDGEGTESPLLIDGVWKV